MQPSTKASRFSTGSPANVDKVMLKLFPTSSGVTEQTQKCRQAQALWSRLLVRQRLRPVRAFRHLLVKECDRFCAALARDLQKPVEETVAGELLPLAAACRFLEREAGSILRPRRVSIWHRPLWLWGQRDAVHRPPRGLIGIIGTWNYPIMLNGVQIMQALVAGNGVVWKPSELAGSSAQVIMDLIHEAGFPADLVQCLPATREAGQDLAQADIDHVVFTGSSATGRRLAEQLGRRLISSTMELSGCDAMFVLEDADIPLAAEAAWFGSTLNRGQTCLAARRALVHRHVYDAFLAALQPVVAAAVPMRTALASQVEQAERLVHDAIAEGARVLAPAPREESDPTSNCCRPTVVVDVRPEMAICREASFAPLLAVMPFDTLADALRFDAECTYGLGASIFTNNPEQALNLAAQLHVGAVTINDVIVPTAHPATPFGGHGESGWGVTQGREGLLEMTVTQVVSTRGGRYRPHYAGANGKPALTVQAFRGLLEWGHAPTLRQRLGGLLRLFKGPRLSKPPNEWRV
jgi:acyl-CoA reductase-like NAD-dependent aldehyde dehydrogenase